VPIFISYSHSDKAFVRKLTVALVKNNAHVWVDTWELNVGDSIVNKIQEAIQSASALLVVLSKSSVKSEWCKKEFSAGLMRELEERRVVVLPVLIENCKLPIFLREKKYADFRGNFKDGLNSILDAVARITNSSQGRIAGPRVINDWGTDWGYNRGLFEMHFAIIQAAKGETVTILTEVSVRCNKLATRRYEAYVTQGLDWLGRLAVTEHLADLGRQRDMRVLLEDSFPKELHAGIADRRRGFEYDIYVRCRRLGEDNGKNQLVNVSNYLRDIRDYMRSVARKPSREELGRLLALVQEL
jgi:hypothetical protein